MSEDERNGGGAGDGGPARTQGQTLQSWADYFRVHAAILHHTDAADVPTILRLYRACELAGLAVSTADDIALAFAAFDPTGISNTLLALSQTDLRFTLLADCYQMGRAAKVDVPEDEPALRRLSALLAITAEQQRAIAAYVQACDPDYDHPWRNAASETASALAWVERSGASREAVTDLRRAAFSGSWGFVGLLRLCRGLPQPLDGDAIVVDEDETPPERPMWFSPMRASKPEKP